MRRFGARSVLLGLLAASLSGPALGDADVGSPAPPAEKTAIKFTIAQNETRDYAVDVSLGSASDAKPPSPSVAFHYKIRHTYLGKSGDDLLPMEVSLLSGKVTTQGQDLEITPNIYPKLTILLDGKLRIVDVYGISSSLLSETQPGINYTNAIILFYLQGADQSRAIGEKWQFKVSIPSIGESYDFNNTLKAVQTVDGVKAATIQQEITRAAKKKDGSLQPRMRATAESAFAIDTGKLLKSHVECDVALLAGIPVPESESGKSKAKQDLAPSTAKMKIDIALVK